jgi:RNA polymerase sigma-70 factor (ECF subfamily)
MNPATRERALVLKAQSGDRDAFDALLRELAPPLLGYLTRITSDRALAEDVLQETLILVVRKIQWLGDPDLFRAWAYRIASREAVRAMKKRKRWVETPDETANELDVAASEPDPDPWLRGRVLAALERLSPASRAVIALHYAEEMPLAEVAAVLDLNLGTVKSRLAYGLAQLRKETAC